MSTLCTYKHELYEEIKYMKTQVDECVSTFVCLVDLFLSFLKLHSAVVIQTCA